MEPNQEVPVDPNKKFFASMRYMTLIAGTAAGGVAAMVSGALVVGFFAGVATTSVLLVLTNGFQAVCATIREKKS